MFVPFLSQHLLMTTVVRAEPIDPLRGDLGGRARWSTARC
jgi:hypothetical protein